MSLKKQMFPSTEPITTQPGEPEGEEKKGVSRLYVHITSPLSCNVNPINGGQTNCDLCITMAHLQMTDQPAAPHLRDEQWSVRTTQTHHQHTSLRSLLKMSVDLTLFAAGVSKCSLFFTGQNVREVKRVSKNIKTKQKGT